MRAGVFFVCFLFFLLLIGKGYCHRSKDVVRLGRVGSSFDFRIM